MPINYNEIWEKKWGDMQKFGPCHLHRRRIMKEMIDFEFRSVLDVGCGEGSNLEFINSLRENLDLTGIDISKRAVGMMREKLPNAAFFELDCQRDKLNKKFDLVTCIDVVEHLPDDEVAIKNLFDMTEKHCLIATIQGTMRHFEKEIGHERNYRIGELEKKMEKVGFYIQKNISWGWPFHSPLYRNFLDTAELNKLTEGKMGTIKRFVGRLIYFLFFLNSYKKGDMLFILGSKEQIK